MGCVLSPIISDMYTDYFETLIFTFWNKIPTIWCRYVDDIFCIWDSKPDMHIRF